MLRIRALPPATGGSSRPSTICQPKRPKGCAVRGRPLLEFQAASEVARYGISGMAHWPGPRVLWRCRFCLCEPKLPVLAPARTRGAVGQGAIMRLKPSGRTEGRSRTRAPNRGRSGMPPARRRANRVVPARPTSVVVPSSACRLCSLSGHSRGNRQWPRPRCWRVFGAARGLNVRVFRWGVMSSSPKGRRECRCMVAS
jgi:hypothetical protein